MMKTENFTFDLQLFEDGSSPVTLTNGSTNTYTSETTCIITSAGNYTINGNPLHVNISSGASSISASNAVTIVAAGDSASFSSMSLNSGQLVYLQNDSEIAIGGVTYKVPSTSSGNNMVFQSNTASNSETVKFSLQVVANAPVSLTAVSNATTISPAVVTQSNIPYVLNGNYFFLANGDTMVVELASDTKTVDKISLGGSAEGSYLDLSSDKTYKNGKVTFSGGTDTRFWLKPSTEDGASEAAIYSISGNPTGVVSLTGSESFTVPGNAVYKIGDNGTALTVSGMSTDSEANQVVIASDSSISTLSGNAKVTFTAASTSTKIGDVTYTSTDGTGTVTLVQATETTAKAAIKTTTGAVSISVANDKPIEINGALISSTSTATVTVTDGVLTAASADVTVTLGKGEAISYGTTKYKNTGSQDATMTIGANGVSLDENTTIIEVGSSASKTVMVSTSNNVVTLELDTSTHFSDIFSAEILGRGTSGNTVKAADVRTNGYSSTYGSILPAPNDATESSADYAITTYAMNGYTAIAVSATEIQKTSSTTSGSQNGAWAGFALVPPSATATKLKYSSATSKDSLNAPSTEATFGDLYKYAGSDTNLSGPYFYCDVTNYKGSERWYAVQWCDNSGTAIGDVQYYRVDFYDATVAGDSNYSFKTTATNNLVFSKETNVEINDTSTLVINGTSFTGVTGTNTTTITAAADGKTANLTLGSVKFGDATFATTSGKMTFVYDSTSATTTLTLSNNNSDVTVTPTTTGVTIDGVKYVGKDANTTISFTKQAVSAVSADSVTATLGTASTTTLTFANATFYSTNNGTLTFGKSGKDTTVAIGSDGNVTVSKFNKGQVIGGVTYKAASETDTMTFTDGELKSFSSGAVVTVTPDSSTGFTFNGVTYRGSTTEGETGGTVILTATSSGADVSIGKTGKITATMGEGSLTIGGVTYTNDKSGSLVYESGKLTSATGVTAVVAKDKTFKDFTATEESTFTIDDSGALTLTKGTVTATADVSSLAITKDAKVIYNNVTYQATEDVTGFTATKSDNSASFTAGSVQATIAAGKTLTVGGITYKENANSTGVVNFTAKTDESSNTTYTPTFGTGSVVVSASSGTKDITVGEVGLTVSNSDTVILTTADSVTSAAVKAGTVKATFNSVDDKIQIGNVTYTATENASESNKTEINFTNKDTDGATLTGGNIQLSKDSANNTYAITDTTVVAGVGSATVSGFGTGSAHVVNISGSADETVSIAKAISSVTSSGTAFTLNEKTLNIYGDSNGYTAVAKSDGTLGEISGISKNAVIADAKEATLNTDNQGTFTFGTSSDSVAYTISGDDSVTFLTDESSKVSNITNFAGTLKSSASSNTINGSAYSITTVSNSSIGAVAISTDGTGITAVNGLVSGETISGDVDSAAISMKGSSGTETNVLTINETTFKVAGDKDGVVITGKEITGLASGATLTANAAGTYTINGETIQISGDEDIIVGNADGSANKKEVGDVEVTSSTTVEEIAEQAVGDTSNRSTLSAAATAELLESDNKDGDYTVNITSSTSTSDSTVDFSESTGKKTVNLTSAADVAFNNEGGNIANISSNVSKATNVSLGNGGDLAVVENSAEVNITAGAGNDTIITKNSKSSVTVDLSAGGATKVMATAGKVVLENYDESKGAGIQTTSNNIAKAVEGGNINGANGSITVGSGVVEISSNDEEESTSTMVNIYNLKGKMQKVGFTNNDGGSVGSSETKQAMVLKGNYSSDKSGGSTMQGGKGNDTIFAGATDEVNAGGGSNVIGLTSNRSGSSDGATINMNAEDNGRTTITGGFDQTSDKLNVGEDATYTYDGEKLVVKNGKSRLTVENATSDSSSSDIARSYDIGSENSYTFIQGSGDETVRVAVGAENGVIAVKSNEDEIATSYHGTKSGIDLTNFEGDAVINLATASATLGGADDVSIDGVTKLMAGNGDAILAGSEANETIAAGSGNVTIWGGKGKDLLVGNNDTENKNGAATFYYQSGDGRDTIQNFTFLNEDTDGLADSIMSTANISEVKATNGNVVIQYSTTDNLIVEGGVGKNISFSDGKVMQVDDELTFDGYANYFVGTSNKATLSVEGENVSNANIWLDNTQSGYYSSNIKVLDASNYEGQSTLVGNANNNTITASKDGALMWGGSSSGNNTLICGAGDDTIYYAGNANDEITGAGESDLIFLGGNLNGVSINIEGTDIAFKYNTGNSVTIENAVTSGVGIQVNGVTYMYNGEGWEQK